MLEILIVHLVYLYEVLIVQLVIPGFEASDKDFDSL
jgi:hypothetical protein